jgi:membrane protein implicated in regulation of membrane protease activity
MRSGLWRTAMTALVAVVVAAVASYGPLRDLLVRYPELLLVNVALIVLVSTYCAWRLLDRLNPERTAARRRGSSKRVHPTLSPPLRP